MSIQHVLVLTDENLEEGNEVPEPIRAAIDHADDLYVIAPAAAAGSPTDDLSLESAERRLNGAFDHICTCGYCAHCEARDQDPIAAIGEALSAFQADLVVMRLSAPAGNAESWRELHLAERVRAHFGLPAIALLLDDRGRTLARDEA
ncbi:MAG TPA: universal stress protein [Solirubrobacteraceae bacterium]|nr:universal stress protein [Solirubrobacteraceae bacterium]